MDVGAEPPRKKVCSVVLPGQKRVIGPCTCYQQVSIHLLPAYFWAFEFTKQTSDNVQTTYHFAKQVPLARYW